jgi:hypothetical protein
MKLSLKIDKKSIRRFGAIHAGAIRGYFPGLAQNTHFLTSGTKRIMKFGR